MYGGSLLALRSWVSLIAAAGELEGSRLLSSGGPEDVTVTPAMGPRNCYEAIEAAERGEVWW